MDPAGPEFYNNPESSRLDKTDAEFVQVIHTNGGGVLQVRAVVRRYELVQYEPFWCA